MAVMAELAQEGKPALVHGQLRVREPPHLAAGCRQRGACLNAQRYGQRGEYGRISTWWADGAAAGADAGDVALADCAYERCIFSIPTEMARLTGSEPPRDAVR
eukprot:CAMPEP_0115871318 /NCGR_PEP_ID=MMETSP0287-20121206/22804_1 /TAXON_ID=412157 /ORGANISM="Chrysochromulina rotalis, Strain UIO044" /LENGTH=102 /DNA_ID=CAMNT_0003326115 /DNA_START=202 /DNA_END=507 /DNA_ORIENTATION=+